MTKCTSQESNEPSHLGKEHWHREDKVLIGALDVLAKVEDCSRQILQHQLMVVCSYQFC